MHKTREPTRRQEINKSRGSVPEVVQNITKRILPPPTSTSSHSAQQRPSRLEAGTRNGDKKGTIERVEAEDVAPRKWEKSAEALNVTPIYRENRAEDLNVHRYKKRKNRTKALNVTLI